jgi:hypothetical protein
MGVFRVCIAVLTSILSGYGSGTFALGIRSPDVPYDSLRLVLEQLYDSDQGVRRKLASASGEEFGKVIEEMQKVDSVNRHQITMILKDYGWLPKSKIGEKASDAIFFAVQHAGLELMKTYLPQLKKRARKKEARKIHAAMMEDRVLMYEGKRQLYGTQATSLGPGNKTFIWPILKPENVNKRRKKAGFDLTVEENAARMDAIYNPEEKLPNIKMN